MSSLKPSPLFRLDRGLQLRRPLSVQLRRPLSALVVGCLLLGSALPSLADVKLPRLVSDGMVLQRDKPLELWGWADEGELVKVQLGTQTKTVTAQQGRWSVVFNPVTSPGAITLSVQGKNLIALNNVVVGDVWLASGQSNMELPIRRVTTRYTNLVASTNLPDVREFNVPTIYSFSPKEDYPSGQWKVATPENLESFSAVGFFFARKMHEQLKVPVGLITIPVGGSPAEAWMSEAALTNYPHYQAAANAFKSDALVQETITKDKAATDGWYGKTNADDLGNKEPSNWVAEQLDTRDWQSFQAPGFFKEQNIAFENGVVYLRKTIELSAAQANQASTLWLGCLVDGDEVYINGQLVGKTGYQYPPRIYAVKNGILHEGKNQIAIRLTSYGKNPGFVKDKQYALVFPASKIDLTGAWQYKIGTQQGSYPQTTTLHYQPTSLFNAKLSPALHTAIKGVIWYQGESNAGKAQEYFTLFPDLIRDWRGQFKQGDLPFVYVQLANFMAPQKEPIDSGWALLREAQRNTLALPNTGMAVALDLGEWNDIHPLNKQDVGERLASAATAVLQGERAKQVGSGPLPARVTKQGSALVVSFTSVGRGLVTKPEAVGKRETGGMSELGGKVNLVALAGADRKFVWAEAKVEANQLVASAKGLSNPMYIRYAWADNPAGANLYNAEGFPASSFELEVPH